MIYIPCVDGIKHGCSVLVCKINPVQKHLKLKSVHCVYSSDYTKAYIDFELKVFAKRLLMLKQSSEPL